jgi:hypothetical protein
MVCDAGCFACLGKYWEMLIPCNQSKLLLLTLLLFLQL